MKITFSTPLRLVPFLLLLMLLHTEWNSTNYFKFDFFSMPIERVGYFISWGLLLIACSCLLHKRTIWIGSMIAMSIMLACFWIYQLKSGIDVIETKTFNQFLNVSIWTLSLLILWNERKNIPFIN